MILAFTMILLLRRYEPVGRVVRGQAPDDATSCLSLPFHKNQR